MKTSLADEPVVRTLDPAEKRKPPPTDRKKAGQATAGKRPPPRVKAPSEPPTKAKSESANSVRPQVAAMPKEEEPSLDWLGEFIKKFNWPKYKALALYWFWKGPVKVTFALMYIAIARVGFANLTPIFAMRWSRIPGLGFLDDSETLYAIDIALVLSAFLFVVVSYCWGALFRLWIFGERQGFESKDKKYAGRFEPVIVCLSFLVVVAELLLFYLSINDQTWGGGAFSFTAMLASAAFVGLLLGVILIGIHLEKNVTKFGEKK
jgi:hypothetical protein